MVPQGRRRRFGLPPRQVGDEGDAHDAHAVLGERARLVRADDGGASQGLHGGQAARAERLVARHALHAQRHDDGGRGGQAFGDDGDGQRYGQKQQGDELPPVEQPERYDGQRRGHAHHGEHLAERRQLALQGGVQLLVAFQQPRDAAHLGPHARGHHHAHAAPARHDGRGEGHGGAVAQGRAGGHAGLGVLFGRHGLAGERGLLHAQAGGVQKPQVGGHHAAVGKHHHVAGHQIARGHQFLDAAAQDVGDRRAHLPQGLQRGLRLALLHDADDGVHHHDDEDDAGLGPFLQQRRKRGRHQQDEHHGVAQLLAHHGGKRLGRLGGKLVGAVLVQPRGRLRVREAVGRGAQGRQHLVRAQGVPARRGGRPACGCRRGSGVACGRALVRAWPARMLGNGVFHGGPFGAEGRASGAPSSTIPDPQARPSNRKAPVGGSLPACCEAMAHRVRKGVGCGKFSARPTWKDSDPPCADTESNRPDMRLVQKRVLWAAFLGAAGYNDDAKRKDASHGSPASP